MPEASVQPSAAGSGERQQPRRAALRIAAIYVACGLLWIGFSDRAVAIVVKDKDMFAAISLVKGWVYMILTGGLLYYLVHKVMRRMGRTESMLREQNAELTDHRSRLQRLAYRDPLTGLRNRAALYEELPLHAGVSLCYFDLDDFQYVNDTTDHAFGDRIVALISDRLRQDKDADERLYRLGGDEWVLVIEAPVDHLPERIRKLLALCERPIVIDDRMLHLSCSVGIARYPQHGSNVDELLRNADIALYHAKRQGRNGLALYDPSMSATIHQRAYMEQLLRQALQKREFELVFQPQIDMASGTVAGFEALLRWNNPELGGVVPERFIPAAEQTQVMIPIGEWVLREACAFIRRVRESGRNDPFISVNVSVTQLKDHRFAERVLDIVREAGILPTDLELEITETTVIDSPAVIGERLSALVDRGVRVALDDFGRGYSSLSHLQLLPISTLKIDKSFIDQTPDRGGKPLTGSMIALAKSMGLRVVAEGVEKYDQLEYLKRLGCDGVQGFLFSRPMPADQALDWIGMKQSGA